MNESKIARSEMIRSWAYGAKVQYRKAGAGPEDWVDTDHPTWEPDTEYRLKPDTMPRMAYIMVSPRTDGTVYIEPLTERVQPSCPEEALISIELRVFRSMTSFRVGLETYGQTRNLTNEDQR